MSQLRPEQIELLPTLSVPTLHPDGSRAVVAVTRPDIASNSYVGQLWTVPLAGAAPSRLTRGHCDGAPRFSPDGTLLAFLRADSRTAKPQLYVAPAGGGEPVCLTDTPLGVASLVWSPDIRRLAYTARDPEPGRYGTDDDITGFEEAPRLITDLRYLADGVGYVGDRRTQVYVLDVPDVLAEPTGDLVPSTQVTSGPYESTSVVWSPDGTRLAFVSARHPERAGDLRADLWTCAPDGTDLVQVTKSDLVAQQVAWSTDGTTLWFLATDPGPTGLDFIARHSGLWSIPADGSADAVRHTPAETVDLGEWGAHLTVTSGGVLVQNRTRGAVELLRVQPGGETTAVLSGPRWVTGHDEVDGVVVASVMSGETPGELVLVSADGERTLTDFAAFINAGPGLFPLIEKTITADDGYPVHGWVVLPEGPGPHPVLLDIHGGPFAQYGWHIYEEAQVLAGAGYAVVLVNPRGSAGYGQEHGRCVAGVLGQRDSADLLDFLDAMIADPELELDADRQGVLGISYGGYMTAWLMAHPWSADRFVAAIPESGFLDPTTFAGTSDIGWFFGDALVGTDPEQVRAQSPMAAIDNVRTPALVIHSEFDYRCPLEQSQRYFAGLNKRNVPSELLIFPGESHSLSVTGQPRHRIQRYDHVLRWWATYLPTKLNPSA